MTKPETAEMQVETADISSKPLPIKKKMKTGQDEDEAPMIVVAPLPSKELLKSKASSNKPKVKSITDFFKPKNPKIPENIPINPPVKLAIPQDDALAVQDSVSSIQEDIEVGDHAGHSGAKDVEIIVKESDEPQQDDEVDDETVDVVSSDDSDAIVEDDEDDHVEELPISNHTSSRPSRAARTKSKPLDFSNSLKDLDEEVTIPVKRQAVKSKSNPKKSSSSTTSALSAKPLFFMNKKEKMEQIQLQRSINLKIQLAETSRLSNSIANATAVNPFFAARATKVKSSTADFSVSTSISSWKKCEAPFPSKDQVHIGWPSMASSSVELPPSHLPERIKIGLEAFDSSLAFSNPLFAHTRTNGEPIFFKKPIGKDAMMAKLSSLLGDAHTFPLYTKLEKMEQPLVNPTLLWTDAALPASYEFIHDSRNRSICLELADWLQAWTDYPDEFQVFKQSVKSVPKKRKRKNDFIVSDEEESSEYESDSDEVQYSQGPAGVEPLDYHPVVMLVGPPGSGKSTIAHIAASHAGYHVLELGPSEKRSGKTLNDVLLNASTSHTVKGKKFSFFEQDLENLDSMLEMGKTCILLEDVDVLGEEDKGFWAALQSVITNSKCPIIMTCAENPLTLNNHQISTGLLELIGCTRVRYTRKLVSEALVHQVALTCAVLGFYISPDVLNQFNFTDFGHALNQLQYYCSSAKDGGKGKSIAVEAGWSELLIRSEPCVEKRIPDVGAVMESLGLQKLDLLFEIRALLEHSKSVEEPEFDAKEAAPCVPVVSLSPLLDLDLPPITNFDDILPPEAKDWFDISVGREFCDFSERLAIYDAINPMHCKTIPSLVATDMIPYLSLICHLDQPRDDSDERALGKRGSRAARRTAKKHIRYLETVDHNLMAKGAFQMFSKSEDSEDGGDLL